MVNDLVFRELIKRGYSKSGTKRVWDVSNHNLLVSSDESAQAFLNLKNFPVYRDNIINRETALIKASASTLRKSLGSGAFNLIDMNCANGERAVAFIKTLDPKAQVRYCPLSLSPRLTKEATLGLKKAGLKQVVAYAPQQVDFSKLSEVSGMLRTSKFQRNVILLMGSSIAALEINDFLFTLSKDLFQGDLLVVGNGIRTGKRLVHLDVYKHPTFDQWFIHLMHGLGLTKEDVMYGARFGNSRVECFYTLEADKVIEYGGKRVRLSKGDEILAAVIYKYYSKELENFCRMYFPAGEFLKDADNEYALVLCGK